MTDAPELNAREKEAHFQGMLLAAEAAESIAPSDEWSDDTKRNYVFGARDAARAIRKIAHMAPSPTPDVREAVKAALEAAAKVAEGCPLIIAPEAVSQRVGAASVQAQAASHIRAIDPDAIIAALAEERG